MIVRWGLAELEPLLAELSIERPFLVASSRWDDSELPAAARWTEIPSHRIAVPAGRGAAARRARRARVGPLTGALEIGASTGPAAIVVPLLLCEFHQANPELDVRLSVHDTQTVVSLVAERELELGIVGAARPRRAVEFEPFFSDEVILVCPPGHPSAGRTVAVDELPEIPLVLMQDGRRASASCSRTSSAARAGACATSTSSSCSGSRSR